MTPVEIPKPRLVRLLDLKPHPRNYRVHPPEQIEHLQASIREHGFYRNVVAAEDLTILAGHGVVEAAISLGLEKAPTIVLPIERDSSAALAILAGDNEIAKLALVNETALSEILSEIHGRDELAGLLGTGYSSSELSDLTTRLARDATRKAELSEDYSTRIESPIYEPRGERPAIAALASTTRRDELLAEIEAADVPDEIRAFLRLAAQRHTRFDYETIANFYAHAEPETRRLMEASALVIIDYDQAIARGYVRFHEAIDAAFGRDYPDA